MGSNDCNTSDSPSIIRLGELSRTARILQVLFLVITAIFALLAMVPVVLMAVEVSGSSASLDGFEGVSFDPLFSTCALGVFAVVFYVVSLMFKDIHSGESPFTNKQANRIRLIAWVLFVYSVLDTLVPKGWVIGVASDVGSMSVYRHESGPIGINVGMFAVSVVFYFLSSVFKYGVELQELSDDTL